MKIEYPTLFLAIFCYCLFFASGIWLWPISPPAALVVMAVLAALQSSIAHECVHGHPFRNGLLNEALAYLPLTLVYPYRRYKALHLKHHCNTHISDPFEDPESYYRAAWDFDALPRMVRGLLRMNNTLIGRLVIGPSLGAIGFFANEARLILQGHDGVRRAWLHHLAGGMILAVLLAAMGIPWWTYLLFVCWPALALIFLRSFAEHRWHESEEGRCIIIEKSPLSWLYLNNNLHLVHHLHPQVPWYELPRLYAESRAEWLERSDGYVFSGYRAVWRRWALRPKEPVAHPAWHRRRPE